MDSANKVRKGKPYRRKLGNFILDKSLQLRYVAFVTVLSTLIASSLYYMIWRQMRQASDTVTAQADDPFLERELFNDDPQALSELKDHVRSFKSNDNKLIVEGVLVDLALILVLSLYLIVMTHKVAGPLYKVSLYFDQMSEGRLTSHIGQLRKGDMLQDFYSKFQSAHGVMRERFMRDNAVLSRFLEACEAADIRREGALGEVLNRLQSHQEKRDNDLS